MKQKLIIFDIDGTLLTSDHQVAESTKEVLSQAKQAGHELCIATGRSRVFAKEVIEEVDLDHYILCNGAAAYLHHEQVYKNTLPKAALKRLMNAAGDHGLDMVFQSMDETKRCSSFDLERLELTMSSFGKDVPDLDTTFSNREDIFQALVYYGEHEKFFDDDEFPEFRFVRWHEYGVDVLPNGGSKAATIRWVAKQMNISLDDVIAFGDGNNDREMLETVGTGVAMGNASEIVRQHADLVTATNDEDGIWKAAKTLGIIQ